MKDKIQLLSTAPLDQSFISRANKQDITLDVVSFIKTDAISSKEIKKKVIELCYLPITAIFTSVNAVKAVSEIMLGADPSWNVYCIGNATKDAVCAYFNTAIIKGTAKDAATLAEAIAANAPDEVIFFCGDQRMDTLPDALRENEITVYEIAVYKTIQTPQVTAKEYDGILFFSPSAVDSFFSVNKIGNTTVLFAIGNTTANAIKKHTNNKTVFSETATKESVLEYAMQYFHKKLSQ